MRRKTQFKRDTKISRKRGRKRTVVRKCRKIWLVTVKGRSDSREHGNERPHRGRR